MTEHEEWRGIKGYEGIYEVSDHGRVRSLDREDSIGRTRTGRVLKAALCDGYPFVNLCKDATRNVTRVHVLVAAAFLGECPKGYEVGHKDHSEDNNRVDNLEYVTHNENMKHAARNGRMLRYLSVEDVQDIRDIYADNPHTSGSMIAEILGVSPSTVNSIVKARSGRLIPNKNGTQAAPIKTTLTVEDITSMQAQGYTLPQIGRYYGVDYSTPYQILGRAKKRAKSAQGIFLE